MKNVIFFKFRVRHVVSGLVDMDDLYTNVYKVYLCCNNVGMFGFVLVHRGISSQLVIVDIHTAVACYCRGLYSGIDSIHDCREYAGTTVPRLNVSGLTAKPVLMAL